MRSLNITVSETKPLFSNFFLVKPNYEHCKKDSTKSVMLDEIAASGT